MFTKKPLARVIGIAASAALTTTLAQVARAADENIQDVPVSVQAISSEEIEATGNQDVAELLNQLPQTSGMMEQQIVTGSYLVNNTFNSAAPIDVLIADDAKLEGIADVGELLQSATVASGSPQVTSASTTEFVQEGGIGANTISLRGLGAQRTLVLLNGRRAGPAGTRGQVSAFDLNAIPLTAVERIEILKDGASSIYGSDAIAGVVNIITKKERDGGTIDAFIGQPTESGGEQNRLSVTWGKTFDRASFSVTADYNKQFELARGDRDYFQCAEYYIFDEQTGERADPVDPRTGSFVCDDLPWGHLWTYDYAYIYGESNLPLGLTLLQYDYDGDLAQYIDPLELDPQNPLWASAPPGWFPVSYNRESDAVTNSDHPFQDQQSLIPKNESTTLFLEGEFEFKDDLTGYAEVLFNRRETYINDYRQFWSYQYSADWPAIWSYYIGWPFGPNPGDEPINTLAPEFTGMQWYSPTAITDHADRWVDVEYQRYLAGLEGTLGDYFWNLSGQYSKSEGEYTNAYIRDDAIQASNQVFSDFGITGFSYYDQVIIQGADSYDPSCAAIAGGPTLPNSGLTCLDIPWFDPNFLAGDISPEMRDYLFDFSTGKTDYTQWSIDGVISGDLVELPAGRMTGAAGFLYQYDEIKDVPGEAFQQPNAWGSPTAGVTEGDQTTKALFVETNIPILAEKPFIQALDLNVSARHTNVDTYGNGQTFKLGVNWAINDQFRVRATRGTSFRTPALYELYLAEQLGFLRAARIDPCGRWEDGLDAGTTSAEVAANCAADGIDGDFSGGSTSVDVISAGASNLEAETSVAKTIGLVWTPEFADLSVSVDYFSFFVEDEITQLQGNAILGCYQSNNFPDDQLCSLFDRDPITRELDVLRDDYVNVNSQNNRGWDIAALYRTMTPIGELTLETQHTIQVEDVVNIFGTSPVEYNGLLGDPEWTGRFSATLDRDDWSFFWSMNIIGEADNYESFGGNTTTYRGETVRVVFDADTTYYHNFSVAKTFMDQDLTVRLGVSNAFDQAPPRVTTLDLGEIDNVGRSAFYSNYDWVGRSFFGTVTWNFD